MLPPMKNLRHGTSVIYLSDSIIPWVSIFGFGFSSPYFLLIIVALVFFAQIVEIFSPPFEGC